MKKFKDMKNETFDRRREPDRRKTKIHQNTSSIVAASNFTTTYSVFPCFYVDCMKIVYKQMPAYLRKELVLTD
jgi:hypothetical protein